MPEPQSLFTSAMSAADSARLREIASAARRLMTERRARVLRYPDLAMRLTGRPVGFADPAQWTGYVPPHTCQEQIPEVLHSGSAGWERGGRANGSGAHTGPTELNVSPVRDALVAICAEAWAREERAGRAGPTEREVMAGLPYPVPRPHDARLTTVHRPAQLDLNPGAGTGSCPVCQRDHTPWCQRDGLGAVWPDGTHGSEVNR